MRREPAGIERYRDAAEMLLNRTSGLWREGCDMQHDEERRSGGGEAGRLGTSAPNPPAANADAVSGAPTRDQERAIPLEWPFTLRRAVRITVIGPAGLILLVVVSRMTGSGGLGGGWSAFGFASGAVAALALAVVTIDAGRRRVPALRLDADGVSARQGWRMRRVSWEEVRTFSTNPGRFGIGTLRITVQRGGPLRIPSTMTGERSSRTLERCVAWLSEPGNRGAIPPGIVVDRGAAGAVHPTRRRAA